VEEERHDVFMFYLDTPRNWKAEVRIQIATDPNFKNILIDQFGIPSQKYKPGHYYWRARTELAGEHSEWSNVEHFYWEKNRTPSAVPLNPEPDLLPPEG
jgi:hypothetical protein